MSTLRDTTDIIAEEIDEDILEIIEKLKINEAEKKVLEKRKRDEKEEKKLYEDKKRMREVEIKAEQKLNQVMAENEKRKK